MKTSPHDIIIRPIITERTMEQMEDRRYTFQVMKTANKPEIKEAIEKVFDVKVATVHTMNMFGKRRRVGRSIGKSPDWKKAIVTLTADSKSIEFFESI
jgi:large subunit ribosomal protein L23